jgi:hypothetical protein
MHRQYQRGKGARQLRSSITIKRAPSNKSMSQRMDKKRKILLHTKLYRNYAGYKVADFTTTKYLLVIQEVLARGILKISVTAESSY